MNNDQINELLALMRQQTKEARQSAIAELNARLRAVENQLRNAS